MDVLIKDWWPVKKKQIAPPSQACKDEWQYVLKENLKHMELNRKHRC